MERAAVAALAPMAHVADVSASIAFYAALGFGVDSTFAPEGEAAPVWAYLSSGRAHLMLSRASAPVVAAEQAVLFYLYCNDVAAMHAQAEAYGLAPGPIATPFYNPRGEFRLVDPDGYGVMIAHL